MKLCLYLEGNALDETAYAEHTIACRLLGDHAYHGVKGPGPQNLTIGFAMRTEDRETIMFACHSRPWDEAVTRTLCMRVAGMDGKAAYKNIGPFAQHLLSHR
jgi:hypothetical protein